MNLMALPRAGRSASNRLWDSSSDPDSHEALRRVYKGMDANHRVGALSWPVPLKATQFRDKVSMMVERVWVLAYDTETGELANFAGCVKPRAAYFQALFEMDGYRVEIETDDSVGEGQDVIGKGDAQDRTRTIDGGLIQP